MRKKLRWQSCISAARGLTVFFTSQIYKKKSKGACVKSSFSSCEERFNIFFKKTIDNNNPTSASWPVSRACARSCLWTARCKSPAAPSEAGSRSTACTGGRGRRTGAGGGRGREGPGLRGAGGPRPGKREREIVFLVSSRVLAFQRTPSHMAPLLTHLCDLEAGYGGAWAPIFGGAAPGFEPRTYCMRVRSQEPLRYGGRPHGGNVKMKFHLVFYIFLLKSCFLD